MIVLTHTHYDHVGSLAEIKEKSGAKQPVNPDITIKGVYDLGKFIPGARIIPTPGHTAGSISLVIGSEVAFVGDTLFNVFPGTVFPPFANDVPELLKSWEKLIAVGCRTFYPGHGKSIPLQKLKDSYDRFRHPTSKIE